MPDPKRTSPADPQILAFFQQELARAGALPGFAAAGSALWPRFAGYYQGLAHLPRRVRRALQRRWRRSLGGLALLCALGQAPALAATINVGGGCTLIDAITSANSDAQTGGCTAGSGADTLVLPVQSTHTLVTVNNSTNGPTGLPVITSELTIEGNLSTITRDSALEFRILAVGATGNLTLQETTISGGAAPDGGGIDNAGTLTLSNSTVEGSSASSYGGGIDNSGTLTLTDSAILSNTAAFAAGIRNFGTAALTTSIIAGNDARNDGGGARNYGTLTLNASTVSGNTGGARSTGGGIDNGGILTLDNSTVEGNTADYDGGGVDNAGTLVMTNSTISGNTAGDRGGGVFSNNTMTLTNSTVSRNASGRVGGGLFNTGTVTLVQSLLSGNTAPVIAPEAYNASGTVIGDGFNLFGHDAFSGVAGFPVGATDVPAVPLPAILDPALRDNGGPTYTHVLVFGSPAVDAVPGASCATGVDQRGALRPQDADGDTVPDCDIGAVERGLIPIQAEILSTTLDCRERGCRVSAQCNLLETECRNPIDITVRSRAVRAADGTLVKGPRRFRFATGSTNIPPGGTQTMRLLLTRKGTRVFRTTERRRLNGLLSIGSTVSNRPPATISTTRVRLRLIRR